MHKTGASPIHFEMQMLFNIRFGMITHIHPVQSTAFETTTIVFWTEMRGLSVWDLGWPSIHILQYTFAWFCLLLVKYCQNLWAQLHVLVLRYVNWNWQYPRKKTTPHLTPRQKWNMFQMSMVYIMLVASKLSTSMWSIITIMWRTIWSPTMWWIIV